MNKKSSLAFICFCILNIFSLDANAGFNKNDFKSKITKELISVISDDKKLEEKTVSIVNKSNQPLSCKLAVWSFTREIFATKSALQENINTPGIPEAYKKQLLNSFENENKKDLYDVDRYCK